MSDDLVKRLRDRGVCSLAHNSCRNDMVCEQAADRIEQLEAERDPEMEIADWQVGFDEGYKRGLEKALEAIANLPTGKSEDIMEGQEQAYRAIEAILSQIQENDG